MIFYGGPFVQEAFCHTGPGSAWHVNHARNPLHVHWSISCTVGAEDGRDSPAREGETLNLGKKQAQVGSVCRRWVLTADSPCPPHVHPMLTLHRGPQQASSPVDTQTGKCQPSPSRGSQPGQGRRVGDLLSPHGMEALRQRRR